MNFCLFAWVEIVVYFLIAILAWQVVLFVESGQLGEFSDPIATLYFLSGWVCVLFLIFSFVSPKLKKQLGLFSFVAGILHSGIFVILDFGCNFDFIFAELGQKYYLYFGVLSLLCLLACAIGSFGGFRRFQLHYGAYLGLIFALVHCLMIQKILTLNYLLIGVGIFVLVGYKFFRAIKKNHKQKI